VLVSRAAYRLLEHVVAGQFLGHLPGDIVIHRENLTIYIPITTMLIVSVVLSVVLSVIGRGR